MNLYARIVTDTGKIVGKGANESINVGLYIKGEQKVGEIDMTCENNELVIDFTNDELITQNIVRGYVKAK